MIGKGHRLAVYTQSEEYLKGHGSRLQAVSEAGFAILPGFSESLLPALVSRHTGCITGTGNVFPKTIRKLYDQAVKGLKGDAAALTEAMALQDRSE
jgi:dihydrodipicolinate synthase/N-acetylneuraminate lyase